MRVPKKPPYRVVQWTTGNVGRSSVQAITVNPTLELVGCYAWSPEKVGRDVGELCGIDPLGVVATDDIDALLALEPDCVVYNPMWLDTGTKSVRVPSDRSIHQSSRSRHYGRASLGFGLTRYPYGLTLVRRPMSRLTRHHWSGGVIGRPVRAGRPLTIPPSQRWCHPLTDSEEKERQ